MDKDIDAVISQIMTGSAIAFVGAGFSIGTRLPAKDKTVPSTQNAKKLLTQMVGFSEDVSDASLSDVAEIVSAKTANSLEYERTLTTFFLNNFTHCLPSTEQKTITNLPWRSIFTTNYDDIIERSDSAEKFTFFSPLSSDLNVPLGKCPVYHLHGRAAELQKPNSLEGFVLSETNYLEIKRFNDAMYSRLFSDIHAASEIVFLGYSLRDLEIASRLFSIKAIARKVSLIVAESISELDLIRLKKFGAIFPIGIEKFAEAISVCQSNFNDTEVKNPSFLKALRADKAIQEIQASNIDDLILTGQFSTEAYLRQLVSAESGDEDSSDLYAVSRQTHIDRLFLDYLKGRGNRFIVASDVGNGKSCFVQQLACQATKQHGFDVYEITTTVNEVYSDIDAIIANQRKSMFIVDGLARYRNIVTYIASRLGDKNILVVTDPETLDVYTGEKLHDVFNGPARLIDINKLDTSELQKWDDLLERWGLWGDKIELNSADRIRFLHKDCAAENRSIILSLFKHSSLASKIDALVRIFVSNNEAYEEGLIAILIRALCHQHVEWSHLVSWLGLNENAIRDRVLKSDFRSLTDGDRGWHEITSPELAGYILNNYDFNAEKIVNTYCQIVVETASLSRDERNGLDSRENMKELLRYRFLTRLFTNPETQSGYINTVYQRLSRNKTIRNKELFWLQWGMARLDLDDLLKAEGYLTTALGLAEKYGTTNSRIQIEDQMARLYFKKNTQKKEKLNKNEVDKAIQITSHALNRNSEILIHPMRSALLIDLFLNEKIDDLDRDLIEELLILIKDMSNIIETKTLERAKRGENSKIRKAIRESMLLLQNY